MKEWGISAEATHLHGEALVWDNHGCMPLRANDDFLPQLQRYRDAGVSMASLNVAFDAVPSGTGIKIARYFRDWLKACPEDYILADTVDDVIRAKAENKLAIAFDLEGGDALDGQLDLVETYYDLGVRWMLMAYNKNNLLGGGCMDDDRGLTDFGRDVLKEMKRVGMVACCSHVGRRTAFEVMELSDNPVIFSHSNPRALHRHKRNIDDETLKACAQTGGVVGINGIGMFLGDIQTETLVRHIDYAVQLIGAEHVGIGLDYVFDDSELEEFLDNKPEYFPGLEQDDIAVTATVQPEQLPHVTEGLLGLGYRDVDILKILGGNHMRVAQEVWKQR